jgi:DNA-binding PadR family transcriptional regulator
MAMVPKGFLRYQVLKLLSEKPMSGSEIMNEIEKKTDGHWKPSPGSIYPLLAWLQDKGYIKEATEQEAGVKRYMLTDQGKAFLEEHVKRREELRKRFRHFGPGPGFMGPMWFEFYPEKAKELRKATKDLAIAVWNLRDKLRQEYSDEAVEEARKVLEEAAKKIEDITKKS